MALPLLLSLVAAGALWGAFGGSMQARFASEVNLLPELTHLEVDKLPYSSGPARLHLAAWGMRLFRERPVFGWGPGTEATTYLAANGFHGLRDGFLRVVRHFAHLHNVYVEILVRFGLVGAALFVASFALLYRSPFQNWRQGVIPTDFFMGGVTILLATLFSGIYEFRMLHTDFRFFMLVFGGVLYTFALHAPQHSRGSTAASDLPLPDAPSPSRAPLHPGGPS
jgi:O-antigen ligase